jgi:preprotein translocase subunit SecF
MADALVIISNLVFQALDVNGILSVGAVITLLNKSISNFGADLSEGTKVHLKTLIETLSEIDRYKAKQHRTTH